MAKNKNKKKNNNRGNDNSNSRPKVVTDLTQEQVDKIEKFSVEEMPAEAEEIPAEELVDTKEDDQRIDEIKRTGNIDGYITMLHSKLVKINAIEKKAEDIKEKNLKEQEALAADRKDFEATKKEAEKEIESERKKNNERQKKLDEEKMAIDNGEYSTVIKSLLDSMRSTEEEITNSTKRRLIKQNLKESVNSLNLQRNLQRNASDRKLKTSMMTRLMIWRMKSSR